MCFHKYEIMSKGRGVLKSQSILFKKEWDEEVYCIIKQCKRCGKRKAWAIRLDNSKIKINPDLIL